jgi:uncharacterized protein YceH (UPF0502 family)
MGMNLSVSETRVLGCLIEKQRTTPDMYPLTLNSLRLACNQSTNRDPVLDYDDAVIRDALHRLERRGFTRLASGRGRSPKYRHLLSEALPMDSAEQAVVCVLMLRGPQTPGELKQRAERMHPFDELASVHDTLERLIARGLAARLERRPGQKEERYVQLLEDPDADSADVPAPHAPTSYAIATTTTSSGDAHRSSFASPAPSIDASTGLEERVARLEHEVADLREALLDVSAEESEPADNGEVAGFAEEESAGDRRAGEWQSS